MLPFDPAIPPLRIYPREWQAGLKVSIAVLFAGAEWWEQPSYPPADEWIKENVVCPHSGISLNFRMKRNPATRSDTHEP